MAQALGAWDDEGAETEHAAHLHRILEKGEGASWGILAAPTQEQIAALDDLDARAPAFGEVTALVRRHLRAAIAIGLPTTLPAIMLVGEPGFGKSWYCKRLAAALGLPVRTVSMNTTTLGESITGANPVWRNARPGIVARTLMAEQVANPMILVDEVDKPPSINREDPYRPFYSLLEPENARAVVDDYLGFAIDASHVSWLLAGNSAQHLPDPIRDRLLVLTIPALDDAQRRVLAASVYAEANASKRAFFAPVLTDDVVDRLVPLTARRMRRALGEAMVRAAADGRRTLLPDDVDEPPHKRGIRRSIGFAPWS